VPNDFSFVIDNIMCTLQIALYQGIKGCRENKAVKLFINKKKQTKKMSEFMTF